MSPLVVLVAAAIVSMVPGAATAAQPARTGEDLTLLLGYGPPTVVLDRFVPGQVRVEVGTTITWVQDTSREHGVTFLAGEPTPSRNIRQPDNPTGPEMRNPLAEFPTLPHGSYDGTYFINSGTTIAGDSFSVTFTSPGVYRYVCIPHVQQGMVGTVEVVSPGSSGITTQAEVDEAIRTTTTQIDGWVAEMLATRNEPGRLEGPGGRQTWFVRVGSDWRTPDEHVYTLLRRFMPDSLTVRRGDTVVWYTDSRTPVHTVTFPTPGMIPAPVAPRMSDGSLAPIELLTPSGKYVGSPDSMEWPRLIVDPEVTRPSRPSAIYDPSKYFNSPPLGDAGSRAWSLTFDTPGTFHYVCPPHVSVGMLASITVLPD